ALRAPQGFAPGKANDKEKTKKGTFLKSFDIRGRRELTGHRGRCRLPCLLLWVGFQPSQGSFLFLERSKI
ncbi:MAG: hypothetical protein WBO19_00420, partial [Terriglobia bacterium]